MNDVRASAESPRALSGDSSYAGRSDIWKSTEFPGVIEEFPGVIEGAFWVTMPAARCDFPSSCEVVWGDGRGQW